MPKHRTPIPPGNRPGARPYLAPAGAGDSRAVIKMRIQGWMGELGNIRLRKGELVQQVEDLAKNESRAEGAIGELHTLYRTLFNCEPEADNPPPTPQAMPENRAGGTHESNPTPPPVLDKTPESANGAAKNEAEGG